MREFYVNSQPINYRKELPYFIGLFIALLLIFSVDAHCKVYPVSVVNVIDGDSLRLKFDNDFEFDARLHGIDAPEISQNLGNLCKSRLETLVSGETLRVWFVAEDKFNRKLVKLVRANYSEINLDMIANGCAWLLSPRRSEREKYRKAFADAYDLRTPGKSLFIGAGMATGTPPIHPKNCKPDAYRRGTCQE